MVENEEVICAVTRLVFGDSCAALRIYQYALNDLGVGAAIKRLTLKEKE